MINKEINMRTTVTLPKKLKIQLDELCKKEHRSLNNLIVNALYTYVDDSDSSKHQNKE